jgi:hypothetical protein
MPAEVTRKLFTVDALYRMLDAGIFNEDDHVELVDGEIVEMSPIGKRHAACVDRAAALLNAALRGNAQISVQNPLRLNDYNEPQPDIVVLKPRADYYASKWRTPEDVWLVIEVSDRSLRYDVDVKVPRYAAAGVIEVWIENLTADRIMVFRDPDGVGYRSRLIFSGGDSVSPLALPESVFQVDDLLVGRESVPGESFDQP